MIKLVYELMAWGVSVEESMMVADAETGDGREVDVVLRRTCRLGNIR